MRAEEAVGAQQRTLRSAPTQRLEGTGLQEMPSSTAMATGLGTFLNVVFSVESHFSVKT